MYKIILLLLFFSQSVFANAECFVGIYVKFDAFKCDEKCNHFEKNSIQLGEYKDPLIAAFKQYNKLLDIVSKGEDLYINKDLDSNDIINKNSRDYYSIGDIRKLYPGYLIADVKFYSSYNNKKYIDINLISPTNGTTVFFHKISGDSKNIIGDFLNPLAYQVSKKVKNYLCQKNSETEMKIQPDYKKSDYKKSDYKKPCNDHLEK